jgi:hypothetical protein
MLIVYDAISAYNTLLPHGEICIFYENRFSVDGISFVCRPFPHLGGRLNGWLKGSNNR